MTIPDAPDTDPSDPAVAAILDRARRLTADEARALDAAVRERPDLESLAALVLEDHRRYLNRWGMFYNWPDPYQEMVEARLRVAGALGSVAPEQLTWAGPGDRAEIAATRRPDALEPDDGSVGWGAASAAAYAVLGSGRASDEPRLKEPWERILGV